MMTVQPLQIVYIEYRDARLYAEVIQSASRDRIWARPLMLVSGLPSRADSRRRAISEAAEDSSRSSLALFDLDQAPDLVWPMSAFEPAMDVEFFSLMVHLKVNDDQQPPEKAQLALRHFLQGCWYQPQPVGYGNP
ncbi:MAG: hypothetical protein AAFZ80_01850 [Cyanobacteria bacterium P01_A01_bin.105]